MEKKGTKIAYFIALAIVVIALVIAKVTNDGSGFIATGWALFPPVVAIALALAAVILVLTRWVKLTKGLHPIVFILASAVVGVVFNF